MSKNLRSDAALKRLLEAQQDGEFVGVATYREDVDLVVAFSTWDSDLGMEVVAEVSLKDVISKRASLKGVEARMKKALRPTKKKAKETLPLAERVVKYNGYTGRKTVTETRKVVRKKAGKKR